MTSDLVFTKKGNLDKRSKSNRTFLENIKMVKESSKRKANSNLYSDLFQDPRALHSKPGEIFDSLHLKRVKISYAPENAGLQQTIPEPLYSYKPPFELDSQPNGENFQDSLTSDNLANSMEIQKLELEIENFRQQSEKDKELIRDLQERVIVDLKNENSRLRKDADNLNCTNGKVEICSRDDSYLYLENENKAQKLIIEELRRSLVTVNQEKEALKNEWELSKANNESSIKELKWRASEEKRNIETARSNSKTPTMSRKDGRTNAGINS